MKNFQDMMIVKTLLYTAVRVSELINIKLVDVDFRYCQIRINSGKGKKDIVLYHSLIRSRKCWPCMLIPKRRNTPIGESAKS
ncbi:tyrosine-type recombinase/integrase [Paenibacillus jamilae]|uniref:tyrosine-type recombinase/integrase n=2 Tax=Paenibacillus TaxID=44249 RepID=UPI0007366F58|nr:tyrosine-type recombinase/integrase [Paenibacillus jamilae]